MIKIKTKQKRKSFSLNFDILKKDTCRQIMFPFSIKDAKSKKIDGLIKLAKDCDEPTFQRKSKYQKFKTEKHIQPHEIQQLVDGNVLILISELR